jgi:transposase-like protein
LWRTAASWPDICISQLDQDRHSRSWGVEETYLKVSRRWVYLYRAVDRDANTVDFRPSPTRDVGTAKAFFRKALRAQRREPVSITLDGYAVSHRAVREMPREDDAWKHTELRSSKYLDNLIEPDHRGIKSRTGSMLGLKDFDCAATTTSGIELLRLLAKDNSPWSVSILETELPLQSGMRPSSHSICSSSGHAAPLRHTCTRTA